MEKERFHELDSLRAIAALGVVCWHYEWTYHAAPFHHLLAPFYGRGLLMVDFFFVLSGFVLARAFWTNERSLHFFKNVRIRLARIYPLHFVTLLFVATMQYFITTRMQQPPFIYGQNTAYNFVLNLLLLNCSGLQHGSSFNAVSWSISTEWIINLIFFAVILSKRRIALPLMILFASVAIVTSCARGLFAPTNAYGWIETGLVRTAGGFFLGALLYQLHLRIKKPWHAVIHDVLFVVLCAVSCTYLGSGRYANWADIIQCYIVFPAIIIAVIRSRLMHFLLSTRPMAHLGEASYSIYLVHFPLLLAAHAVSLRLHVPIHGNSYFYFFGFFLSVIFIATITYQAVELPGKRLFSKKSPAFEATAQA